MMTASCQRLAHRIWLVACAVLFMGVYGKITVEAYQKPAPNWDRIAYAWLLALALMAIAARPDTMLLVVLLSLGFLGTSFPYLNRIQTALAFALRFVVYPGDEPRYYVVYELLAGIMSTELIYACILLQFKENGLPRFLKSHDGAQ